MRFGVLPRAMATTDKAVSEYLTALAAQHPEYAEAVEGFESMWKRKLWHQLTDAVEEFFLKGNMTETGRMVDFYDNFIKSFATRLNKLRLAQIVRRVSENYAEVLACKEFVEGVIEMVKDTDEAVLYLRTRLASVAQAQEDFKTCKSLIDDVREKLDEIPDADPVVHSALTRVAMEYHRTKGTPTQYYKNALLFLHNTPADKLTEGERKAVAYEMSIAACVGPDIYNFGELLIHPTISTLEGGDHDWLFKMLVAFNQGSIEQLQGIIDAHASTLETMPAMVANKHILIEKITICALLELIFSRAADDRRFSYDEVAAATRRQLNEVDHVLMKGMSLGLVRGMIDEVDQCVDISWVKPRMLQSSQLVVLQGRLGTWAAAVSETIKFVESNATELVATS